MSTTGARSATPASDPKNGASAEPNTPPSAVATHVAPGWPGTSSTATARDSAISGAAQSAAAPRPSTDHAGGVGVPAGVSADAGAARPSVPTTATPATATARNLRTVDS